jgi:hypothetical protein
MHAVAGGALAKWFTSRYRNHGPFLNGTGAAHDRAP